MRFTFLVILIFLASDGFSVARSQEMDPDQHQRERDPTRQEFEGLQEQLRSLQKEINGLQNQINNASSMPEQKPAPPQGRRSSELCMWFPLLLRYWSWIAHPEERSISDPFWWGISSPHPQRTSWAQDCCIPLWVYFIGYSVNLF